jgi:hypothetical protein
MNVSSIKGYVGRKLTNGYGTSIVKTSNRGYIVCCTQYGKHHLGEVIMTVPYQGITVDQHLQITCDLMNGIYTV